jgi:hypothetical protein
VAVPAAAAKRPRPEADELMIRWNDLPRDSRITLYLPDVDARQIVAAAAARNGPPILWARDGDTILSRVGDVSWIPVPGPRALNIPGLLSIELPPTVSKGQTFTVTIHQVSGLPRKVVGAFQITVAVRAAPEILPRETRRLSVLRYIGQSIPPGNRWHPIWQRLLGQIVDRVRGLGGDPDDVHPSPTGDGRPCDGKPPHPGPAPGVVCGEVKRILYDCAGRFEGFVLVTCGREHAFETCARGIEEVVLRACRDRLRLTVRTKGGEVERVAVDCC